MGGGLWSLVAAIISNSDSNPGCVFNVSKYGPGHAEFSRRAGLFVKTLPTESRSRRHAWGRTVAHEALAFVSAFIVLPENPPPPVYVSRFSSKDTLGQYANGQIKLRSDLHPDLERWVTIHELLHHAGFGYGGAVKADTDQIYRDDIDGATKPPKINTYHWDSESMTGMHRRSGQPAADEIMTSHITGVPFLSAATLFNLHGSGGRNWCTKSTPCPNDNACTYPDPYLPGWCGVQASQQTPGNHPQSVPTGSHAGGGGAAVSTGAIIGIVVGSIFALVLIGFFIQRRVVNQSKAGSPYHADSESLLASGAF